MCDTVAATGLRFQELEQHEAVKLRCLSELKRRQRRGRLSSKYYLCQAAAGRGQLEELKALRADGCPWGELTCAEAAKGGHLELLQWLRVNGCPWGVGTCAGAALGGHLEVLQWARANGCPWTMWTRNLARRLGLDVEAPDKMQTNGAP